MRQRQSKAQEADIGNLSTYRHQMKKRTKTNEKAIIHPTNSEVQRIKKDIRSLRDSGKFDTEIREILGLELRTYQKYVRKIHEEDQIVWISLTQDQMAGELIRLKDSLEDSYRTALAMSKDESSDIGDRLEALDLKDQRRLDIVKLLGEAPDMLRKVQIQLPHIETRPYVENYDWRERGTIRTNMRANKPVMLVGFREKQCKIYFHCPRHNSRLVRIKNKWICSESCGIISTIDLSILRAQELKQKDVN